MNVGVVGAREEAVTGRVGSLAVVLVGGFLAACGAPASPSSRVARPTAAPEIPTYASDADFEREVVARFSAIEIEPPAGVPVDKPEATFGPNSSWVLERDAQPNRAPLIWNLLEPHKPPLLVPDDDNSARFAAASLWGELVLWERRSGDGRVWLSAYRVDFERRKLDEIWKATRAGVTRVAGEWLIVGPDASRKFAFFHSDGQHIKEVDEARVPKAELGRRVRKRSPLPPGMTRAELETIKNNYTQVHVAKVLKRRWLVLEHFGNAITVVDLQSKGHPVTRVPADYGFVAHTEVIDDHLYVLGDGKVHIIPLASAPPPVTARIDDVTVTWQRAPASSDASRWPRLIATPTFERKRGGGLEMKLSVSNVGTATGYNLVAHVRAAPETALRPLKLHFGTVEPGATIVRSAELAVQLTASRRPYRVVVEFSAAHDFTPAPVRHLVLPRRLRSRQGYERVANRVFALAVDILREELAWPEFKTNLQIMQPSDFGFTHSESWGGVSYQDLFALGEVPMRVNRQVTRAETREELLAHGEMMLYWFIPHEVIHAATSAGGTWSSERTANLIQPYLTAKILERMGDEAPYTAETMAWVYDRYVDILAPRLSPKERKAVDAFARHGHPRPFPGRAGLVFLNKTAPYVYMGARINQMSWRDDTTLGKLLEPYRKKARTSGANESLLPTAPGPRL